GPVDLKRLREGRFETVTEGRLAEAEIAFLDEIFHAGSAILNTLLGILNDGWFRRGQEARRTPLHFALAATNTASDDPALRALQDRFTLRVAVDPLPDERVDDLLEAGWILERERLSGAADEPGEPDAPKVYGMDSLRALSREVSRVDVRPSREQLIDLVRRLRGAGIYVSDRRVVKLQRLAAASAILCGRRALIPSDIWPARYLWEHEDERAALMEIATESIERFDGATMRSDPHGAPADHPFAFAGRDPARILAALSRLEDEIDRLGKAPALDAVDALHNRLHDIDRERRWCRVRGPADATALAEIRSRLDELVAALASIGGERR
ncbi:MAG TPA: AAA family ATPase, partial [Planctomycetota bacterium]|nr:AAA family ATPase [Planctomycetota bacterium]